MNDYHEFIRSKKGQVQYNGFEPKDLPSGLFGHQKHMVEFACRAGSAACFYDTGLGKTAIQLAYADQVRRHTNKPVLIMAPMAVGPQTAREAERFEIEDVRYIRDPEKLGKSIVVTNYERLKLFSPADFGGVVLDESSIIKSFTGPTSRGLIEAFKNHNYRMALTATPAPNDHMELGQHSAFLGVMSSNEMLSRWFIADQSQMGKYRLKNHAVAPFWQWVASWAQAARKPSDVGDFGDSGYDLPEYKMHRHLVKSDIMQDRGDMLFRIPDMSATSLHKEKRMTLDMRADVIADLVSKEPDEAWILWCDTDYEADALKDRIKEAVEVRGSHKPELKEQRLIAFSEGQERVLITKPKIAGFGLNWQHCARVGFVGLSYSYESFYQAVRRCWRFGQTRNVQVHAAMAQTELALWDTITRKKDDHKVMADRMVKAMKTAGKSTETKISYNNKGTIQMPEFLGV